MRTFLDTEARTFAVEQCINCGCLFGINTEMRGELLRTHKDFYCPNGHGQHFTAETEAARLRRRLERSKSQLSSMQDQYDASERQRRAYKGHVTRLKRRISKGICPCCDKQFKDVARHMKSQHPMFSHGRGPSHEAARG